jgi:predicted aminopeptidase
LLQAAGGQLDLATSGRPLEEAIEDLSVPPFTRRLLSEILRIKEFGSEHGLAMHENYRDFVQLDRRYVVWFVNASAPLAFYPKTFWFPVVGSFPGLSWFEEENARDFADDLREEGWDVNVRGVTAFSTGGWFDDPIVSSMLVDHPAALGFLVNTVLHESVHATVLAPNQQYFNESLASFVANDLAPQYLTLHFGAGSEELRHYTDAMDRGLVNFELMAKANLELTAIYASDLPDVEKAVHKKRVLGKLSATVPFEEPPNNATLIGVQLYNEGKQEMAELQNRCGTWQRFLTATGSLRTRHFGEVQSPVIGPALRRLTLRGCEPFPIREGKIWLKQLRDQRARTGKIAG